MESQLLKKVIAEALLCPSLTMDELRFLHSLHLRLLAEPSLAVSADELDTVLRIMADQREREGR